MRLQLLVLLETNDESKTDGIYFSEIRKRFYTNYSHLYEGEVSIEIIPLGGKQNYNNAKIVDRIKNQSAINSSYDVFTVVIYFIDTDSIAKEYKPGSFFYNICEYCSNNGYELVWYCKNAENVFLGKEPGDYISKTNDAKTFARKDYIYSIDERKLSKSSIEIGCSNVLIILDKYLIRKT